MIVNTEIMLLPSEDEDAESLPERLSDLLYSQFNLISREQAVRYGITQSALRHRLRPGGSWQKILPGIYSVETGAVTLEQRQMAALMHAGRDSVLTGAAAVRRHRLTCAGGNSVEVLVPAECRVKGHGFVRILRTERMPDGLFSVRRIRYAPLARAAGDAARAMLKAEEVRDLVSEVVHNGRDCTVDELVKELRDGPAAGSALLRGALVEMSEGIRSEGERDFKIWVGRSPLPRPMYNPKLFLLDGTFLAIPDAWWPRAGVAGEVDSLAHHILTRDHQATMARRNRMEAADIRVLQFLPKDIADSWPTHLENLQTAIKNGMKRPPLPIVAVPANVQDVRAYLQNRLGDSHAPHRRRLVGHAPAPSRAPS